jgi:hypothetical protein
LASSALLEVHSSIIVRTLSPFLDEFNQMLPPATETTTNVPAANFKLADICLLLDVNNSLCERDRFLQTALRTGFVIKRFTDGSIRPSIFWVVCVALFVCAFYHVGAEKVPDQLPKRAVLAPTRFSKPRSGASRAVTYGRRAARAKALSGYATVRVEVGTAPS